MDGMSLLDVLRGVMLDPAEQAAYNADPGAYLGRYGYDGIDPADLSEAFGLVADTLPPDQAQQAVAATTAPGDSTFGTVNADFDTGGATGPPEVAPEADAAPPDPSGEAGLDDVDDLDDAGPSLSFGEGGDGVGDLDDPFDDDAADGGHGLGAHDGDSDLDLDDLAADGGHGLGYDGPEGTPDEGVDDLDGGFDGGGGHDDLDEGAYDGLGGGHDGLLAGLDDATGSGLGDPDDLTGTDELGGGPDPGPGDDFDIGSF